MWARAEQDPIKMFEKKCVENGIFTEEELKGIKKGVIAKVKKQWTLPTKSTCLPRI